MYALSDGEPQIEKYTDNAFSFVWEPKKYDFSWFHSTCFAHQKNWAKENWNCMGTTNCLSEHLVRLFNGLKEEEEIMFFN